MLNTFYFFIILNIFIPINSLNYTIEYQNEDDPKLEENITKPILALAFGQEPTKEIQQSVENFGLVLCTFPEETLKNSPSLLIYCIIIAILWLFLILTICFGYVRQIIDRIRAIAQNGFTNNRENLMVNEEGANGLQGLFSFGSTALNTSLPLQHNNK